MVQLRMCVSELCAEKIARAVNSPPEAYHKRSCVYDTTFLAIYHHIFEFYTISNFIITDNFG